MANYLTFKEFFPNDIHDAKIKNRILEAIDFVEQHQQLTVDSDDGTTEEFGYIMHEEEFPSLLLSFARDDSKEVNHENIYHLMKATLQLSRENFEKRMRWTLYCLEKSDNLKVFYVFNTNDIKMTIIAQCRDSALDYAELARHIRHINNARVMILNDEETEKLKRSGDPLGRALRAGKPGIIEFYKSHVLNRSTGEAFFPVSVVE